VTSFKIKGEFIELYKLLKVVGLAESGSAAKQLITEGQVCVNGTVETRKGCKIRRGAKVTLANETLLIE